MTLSTCLTGMTKNSLFLRLWPFLWGIAHCFGVLGDLHGPWHFIFEKHDQKLTVFVF
jgi:hypothetical protein